MRCNGCSREVSTVVPEDTVIRAVIYCPECILKIGERLGRIEDRLTTLESWESKVR